MVHVRACGRTAPQHQPSALCRRRNSNATVGRSFLISSIIQKAAGDQDTIQKKMIEVCKLVRAHLIAEGQLDAADEAAATTQWYKDVDVNGLCGGWVKLFMKCPEWVSALWGALVSWDVPSTGTNDQKLRDLNNHLARTTEVVNDGKGAYHVVRLLRDAYEIMNELEPTANYGHAPGWTDLSITRYVWISSKTPTTDRSMNLKTTSKKAAADVTKYLEKLVRSKKIDECMAHVETDKHHIALLIQKQKTGTDITVVESEKEGIARVTDFSQVTPILDTWMKTETGLRDVDVRTRITYK